LKILIADDDLISRRILGKILEQAGYEVLAVENGRKAVELLAMADGPRLALIDWVMPELDGPGVCHEMRKLPGKSYVYIILLTSKESKEDIVAGLKSGADDYLIKPCHPEELKARLLAGKRILQLEDQLVQAREEMRFKASYDALTSLWNRGVILELLDKELERSRREHSFVSLLLCDIDHFKHINDLHGHPVGDEVLRQVSKRLLGSVRSYDFVGRYGGEEFLILLIGCDAFRTTKRADGIREAVASHGFPTASGPLNLTISVGVLACADWPTGTTGAELLKLADESLYRAKAAGRNCVFFAQPSTESVPTCVDTPSGSN
jgi:two-component system cell cycle response regulator